MFLGKLSPGDAPNKNNPKPNNKTFFLCHTIFRKFVHFCKITIIPLEISIEKLKLFYLIMSCRTNV